MTNRGPCPTRGAGGVQTLHGTQGDAGVPPSDADATQNEADANLRPIHTEAVVLD